MAWRSSFHLSPPPPARGLEIGMHIPHMEGSKVTNHIFDICLEAEIFKYYISALNSSHNSKAREKL